MAKKLTEKQLSTINDQQKEIGQLLRDIGFLETQKHGLLHKYAGVVQEVEDFKVELEKQYGAININVEDGTYTPLEDKKEKSE
tara:strand:+ start:647 stop:895 length:249 start_codon:yes stop_codon:yes gene_type:complete